MQKGEIDLVLESIKGIPYSAEVDEILNDKTKNENVAREYGVKYL